MSAEEIHAALAQARKRIPTKPPPDPIRWCREHDNTFDVRETGCIEEDCYGEWLVGHERHIQEGC